MRRFICALCALLLLLPVSGALALSGQSYALFEQYYAEDLDLINDSASLHLLPLVLSKRGATQDQVYYELEGDVLDVTVTVEPISQIVLRCLIQLTAPEGMAYGDATYQDFRISALHSYALQMAMQTEPSAYDRYALVTDVQEGMKSDDGLYSRQVGIYTLNCSRDENTVYLEFVHNSLPTETPAASPETAGETPSPDMDDEPMGMG